MGRLMEELTSTENRIAFARQGFNDGVTAYNISTEVFPNNILAGMFRFDRASLWEVENEAEKEAPSVSF
jgi:LemA protein